MCEAQVRATLSDVRALLAFALVIIGCGAPPPPLDAAAPDAAMSADAAPADGGPPDANLCPSHAVIRAPEVRTCLEAESLASDCDATIDAPTFHEVSGPELCEQARATSGVFRSEVTGAITATTDCDGTSFLAAGQGYRVDARRHTAAAILASGEATRVVAEARIREDGECVRRLRVVLEGGVVFEVVDLPPSGGVVELEPSGGGAARELTLAPIPHDGGACPDAQWICMTGVLPFDATDPEGIAVAPCGESRVRYGACDEGLATVFVGSAGCGGRIHAAMFSSAYVPICL